MPAAAEAAAVEDGQWHVIDTNAIAGHREHMVGGKTYRLSSEPPGMPMPAEDAVVFLCDAAFKVFNEKGQPVASLPKGATEQGASEMGGIRLDAGETVAKFGELTQAALLARAKFVPGGERFKKTSGRADLVKFLVAHSKRNEPRPDEDSITDPAVAAMGSPDAGDLVEAAGGIEAMKAN